MNDFKGIAYEPHPVTPERKAELRAQGFRIIDARFKPAGAEDDDGASKPLTVAQIKAALAEKNIDIPDGVTLKADLQALLDGAGASNEESK